MKLKKIVSMMGMMGVLFSAVLMITGCPDKLPEKPEYPEYTKDEFTFKFKNESGKDCYIEISGESKGWSTSYDAPAGWKHSIDFPTVLKTAIPAGNEKAITVKDVVVSGKTSKETHLYKPSFGIHVIPADSGYYDQWKTFISESKSQYTKGIFHIKLEKNNSHTFTVDYIN